MYNSSKITNIEILLPDALCASGEMRQIQSANFGHPSSGYPLLEEVEFPLTKTKAGADMRDKTVQFPTKWELYKPNFYRRQISKTQYEFKYRVNQKDGVGQLVDTYRKMNEKNEPFRTYQEARAHRNAVVAEIMARTPRSLSVPNIHTLQEIFEHYISYRGEALAPNTINKHAGNMRTHITPHFKRRPIETITLGEVKNFVIKLRMKKAKETVKSVIATMASIWKYAYEMGIIDKVTYLEIFVDTATKVTIPKMATKNKVLNPETYTVEQMEQFFALAKQEGDVYYILMQLCYYSGMRLSEALGLRFSNIDWDTGKITIDHQLIYNKNTHIEELTTTKSKTERVFDAPPALLEILKDWKTKQDETRKQLGRKYKAREELTDRRDGKIVKGGDFVLRDDEGALLTHSQANHIRERIQKKTGLHFYYHGLRHTVVSRLAGSGVPVKNISTYIGHADTRTTELFYLGIDEIGSAKLTTAICNL